MAATRHDDGLLEFAESVRVGEEGDFTGSEHKTPFKKADRGPQEEATIKAKIISDIISKDNQRLIELF